MIHRALLLLVTLLSVGHAQRRLIWNDEFNGPAGSPPDATKWTYDLGAGAWGNHELEIYTNSADNIHQDGHGHLVIRVTKEAFEKYRSARIKTQGQFSFTYGRVEARMKLPEGQGLWPAFWMLGDDIAAKHWPGCGEIDVMENVGREPGVVHATVHGPGYSGAKGITAQFTFAESSASSDGYHLYAAEWSSGKIVFFVDEQAYATVTPASLPHGTKWVYDHPFFLLLNVAVGGEWPGNPDATTQFPQELMVDWIRVYAENNGVEKIRFEDPPTLSDFLLHRHVSNGSPMPRLI